MLEPMPLERLAFGSMVHPQDPGEGGTRTPRVSVTAEEAEILASLARERTVLEIGTGLGVSTLALASAATRVDTVDVDPWVHQEVWPQLGTLGNVETFAVIPDRIYDMVFIDGAHSTSAVRADIDRTWPLCRDLLVFHDVNYQTVADAVRAVFPDVEVIATMHGLGVVRLHG